MSVRILVGDCVDLLSTLPDESVHCVVTSSPYWGLRDYGVEGAIGLERTFGEHLETIVTVLREVRRVLRKDGTLWLNYGDAYAGGGRGGKPADSPHRKQATNKGSLVPPSPMSEGLKPKDLLMMPARVALALQADGWWLRSEIVWHKPNSMPESVRDRPTSAHEKIYLLAKSARYFYDAEAISEPSESKAGSRAGYSGYSARAEAMGRQPSGNEKTGAMALNKATRNLRNVWTISTHSFPDAHFATFPPKLVEPCIKAGTSERGACPECGAPWTRVTERKQVNPGNRQTNGPRSMERRQESAGFEQRLETQVETLGWQPTCEHDTEPVRCKVLDPFGGAGTVGLVASRLGRDAILIELSPEYAEMAERRIHGDAPLLADVAVSA